MICQQRSTDVFIEVELKVFLEISQPAFEYLRLVAVQQKLHSHYTANSLRKFTTKNSNQPTAIRSTQDRMTLLRFQKIRLAILYTFFGSLS